MDVDRHVDASHNLSVVYNVADEPDLENLVIRFGPVPTADLAPCDDGLGPVVRVGTHGAVRGSDASGQAPWETKSISTDVAHVEDEIRIFGGLP